MSRALPHRVAGLYLGLLGLTLSAAAPASQEETPQIPWQRTLTDAFDVARRTGKPVLLAVNTDGESASDRLAESRYRSAAFVELASRFVPVILSPERHAARDHDERGVRVPCTRFGVVTCGEHMRGEPVAFARWFGGRRVAPRHVGISPDGEQVLFDLFLLGDLGRIDAALSEYGPEHTGTARVTKLESRDAADRAEVEARFLAADTSARRALLSGVRRAGTPAPELIRMTLAANDEELSLLACETLAATAEPEDVDLLHTALGIATGAEVDELIEALVRVAPDDPRTQRAAGALQALARGSKLVRPSAWRRKLAAAAPLPPTPTSPPDLDSLGQRLEELYTRSAAARDDADLLLELARAHLDYAVYQLTQGGNPSYNLADAEERAGDAAEAGADREEVVALRARCAWYLGEGERATELVADVAPWLVRHATTRDSALALEVFLRGRAQTVYAEGFEQRLTAEEGAAISALADALAAGDVLSFHPYATAAAQALHADLLGWVELTGRRGLVLREALARFPRDPGVHERWRAHVTDIHGASALEAAYDELGPGEGADAEAIAAHEWFVGYATLVVAEHYRRTGDGRAATAAYARAEVRFRASAGGEPSFAESADHYVALAHLGEARTALDERRYEDAVDLLLGVVSERPQAMDWPDGLGQTGRDTLARLRESLGGPVFEGLALRLDAGLISGGFE